MPEHHFEHTKMLIADAGGQIRTEIKQVLRYEGFRNIVEAENVDDAREAVINNYIDVIITDNILNQADMCQSIRDIRHGALGNNPFIVVITMATDPAREDIMSIIDSGADDIILKPITAGMIVKRVRNLVTERKLFVVTSDYIGPTRRSSMRAGSQDIPHYGVPNPLSAKAGGIVSDEDYQLEIDKYAAFVNIQKLECNASYIAFLIDRLLPAFESGSSSEIVPELLKSLKITCDDAANRLNSSDDDHVSELNKSILKIVDKMAANPSQPDQADLKRLPEMALAIEQAFFS